MRECGEGCVGVIVFTLFVLSANALIQFLNNIDTSNTSAIYLTTLSLLLLGIFGIVFAVCISIKYKRWLVDNSQDVDVKAIELATGGVYLLKAGTFYKIGKATVFDRRIKQIKLQLPFPIEVIHKIHSHNISEVEIYWHRRFAHNRKNGEWFELTDEDVAEFKSKLQM